MKHDIATNTGNFSMSTKKTRGKRAVFIALLALFFLFFLLSCWTVINPAGEVEAAELSEDFYDLTADNISYQQQQGILEATGAVKFAAAGYRFEADELTVYLQENKVIARGKPLRVITEEEEFFGTGLTFNYETGEGEFLEAETKIDEVTFRGNKLRTVTDDEFDHILELEEALYTPCLLPDPHYSLRASKVTLYPGDRVVAQDASFYWGDLRLIALPYYVIEYIEDPDDPEERVLADTGFIYEIGYDTQEGLYLELSYPYEVGDWMEGHFFYSNTMRGTEVREFRNNWAITDNLALETGYDFQEFEEEYFLEEMENDEDYQWQEDFSTTLTYTPVDHFSLKTGYDFLDEEGEWESRFFAGWEHDLTAELVISQQQEVIAAGESGADEGGYLLDFVRTYADSDQEEREEWDRSRPLTSSLAYSPGGRELEIDWEYDFYDDSWRQEYYYQELLGAEDNLAFSFYHDYQERDLDRRSYQLELLEAPVDWNLRYRAGYEEDYLPYLEQNYPLEMFSDDLSLVLGWGRLKEEEEERKTNQLEIIPDWQRSWDDLAGWDLTASSTLSLVNYFSSYAEGDEGKEEEPLTDWLSLATLENKLEAERDFWQFSRNNYSLQQSGGLELATGNSWGESFLARNEVETEDEMLLFTEIDFEIYRPENSLEWEQTSGIEGERENYTPAGLTFDLGWSSEYNLLETTWLNSEISTGLRLPTAPLEGISFDFAGDYDHQEREWEELNFSLERELDCYSYSLNYEAVSEAFYLGFDLDL